MTDVSVAAVNYNTARLLNDTREALYGARGGLTLQPIVIDNASHDGSGEALRKGFSNASLIFNQTSVGFGRADDQAIRIATGRYVLLLNTDAFMAADMLGKTVAHMGAHPECGALGVGLIGRDGERQLACRYFPMPWDIFLSRTGLSCAFSGTQIVDPPIPDAGAVRTCDRVVGCYMHIPREVIASRALFNPRYFLDLKEIDFCPRVKHAGWGVAYFLQTSVVCPDSEGAKVDGATVSTGRQILDMQVASESLYFRKNLGLRRLAAFAALACCADLMHALKWLGRLRGTAGLQPTGEHAVRVGSLLFRTGTRTTPNSLS